MATSPSELSRRGVPALAVVGTPHARRNALLVSAAAAAWLAYSKIFFGLARVHATLPPCPFLYLTGQPCPFCGGTHAFAELWAGDVRQSILDYPLAPVLFAATVAALPVLLVAAVFRVELRLSPRLWKIAGIGAAVLIAINWGLKLTVLPPTPR